MKEINPTEIADRIEDALERGDLKEALELSSRAIKIFPKSADIWALRAEALDEIGEIVSAVGAFSKTLKYASDWGPGYSRRSSLYIEMGKLKLAEKDIEKSILLNKYDPEAIFNLAIINELEGNEIGACTNYKKAAELDPFTYFMPVRVTEKLFEEMVTIAIERLPEKLRDYMTKIPVTIKNLPERDIRGEWRSICPLIMGEITGESVPEKALFDPWSHFPSMIVLYKKNFERACRNTKDLLNEIENTIFNEVIEFLGFEEEQIKEIMSYE